MAWDTPEGGGVIAVIAEIAANGKHKNLPRSAGAENQAKIEYRP